MRLFYVLIICIGWMTALPANACRWRSHEDYAAAVRADLKRQESMVTELALQADLIVVAKAGPRLKAPDGALLTPDYTGQFEVIELLKGQSEPRLLISSPGSITVACAASASFRNTAVAPGTTYILYLRDGQLLRAAPKRQPLEQLSFRKERKLLRPNNSFKPKPLRGSA
jgi:hypothetical protein